MDGRYQPSLVRLLALAALLTLGLALLLVQIDYACVPLTAIVLGMLVSASERSYYEPVEPRAEAGPFPRIHEPGGQDDFSARG